jgi:hypothetical protein
MKAKPRVAVLLYGYLRTYETTCTSFFKHVADYLDADIFYFGQEQTDRPTPFNLILDKHGFIKENLKNQMETVKTTIDQERIAQIYGKRLKKFRFHGEKPERFEAIAATISRDEWLFKTDPSRIFSLMFNMTGAYKLMEEYQRENNIAYDVVIMTRPDLAFYSPLDVKVKDGEIHISNGQGFHPSEGYKWCVNAPAFFYRNTETGDAIPSGDDFNDQILVLTKKDAPAFGTLFDDIIGYARMRVPLTSETLLYFHFCVKKRLAKVKNNWLYDIFRFDQPTIFNITDLPKIREIDPYNPKAQRS